MNESKRVRTVRGWFVVLTQIAEQGRELVGLTRELVGLTRELVDIAEREAERVEAERVEAERVEAERVEAEHVEAEHVERSCTRCRLYRVPRFPGAAVCQCEPGR
jgi:hypothetical protein